MKLIEICTRDANPDTRLQNFAHAERFVNNLRGKDVWTWGSEIDHSYSPESGNTLNVPYTRVPIEAGTVVESNPDPRLRQRVIQDGAARFFWHPASSPDTDGKTYDTVPAVPTSSVRTLLTTEDAYPHMIKVSMPFKHFYYDRSISADSARYSVAVNSDLAEFAEQNDMYGYMPESLAVTHNQSGVIFREMKPRPVIGEEQQLIPAFALYSQDMLHPEDPPLIVQAIYEHQPDHPVDYLLDKVVDPVQNAWIDTLEDRGLLLDLHAQNCLFELGDTGDINRLVIRDFQSIFVDSSLRQAQGLPQLREDTYNESERALIWSMSYDHYIGNLFFRRLIPAFTAQSQHDPYTIAQLISERFREKAGDEILESMPETIYTSPQDNVIIRGTSQYANNGESPLFRPASKRKNKSFY